MPKPDADAEKLRGLLNELRAIYKVLRDESGDIDVVSDLLTRCAARLDASRAIPVAERLPEQMQGVAFRQQPRPTRWFAGYFEQRNFVAHDPLTDHPVYCGLTSIIDWMPLPPPPTT